MYNRQRNNGGRGGGDPRRGGPARGGAARGGTARGGTASQSRAGRSQSPAFERGGATDTEEMKTIFLFVNGNEYTAPRRFTVSTRRTKSWEALLQQVTEVLKPKSGYVRSLHTPEGGTRVRGLGELESRKSYVAVSTWEPFKATEHVSSYLYVEDAAPFKVSAKWRSRYVATEDSAELNVPELLNSGRDSSPRGGPESSTTNDGVKIFCYLNGDAITPALPVVLRPLDFANMKILLMRVSERLHVDQRLARPLRRLYMTNGSRIYEPSEIEPGEEYVAAPMEQFRDANYGTRYPPMFASQRIDRRKVQQLGYLSISAQREDDSGVDGRRSRSRLRDEARDRVAPLRRSRSETPQSNRSPARDQKRSRSEDRAAPKGAANSRGRGRDRGRAPQRQRSRSRSGSRSQSRSSSRNSRSGSRNRTLGNNAKRPRGDFGSRDRNMRGSRDRQPNKRGDAPLGRNPRTLPPMGKNSRLGNSRSPQRRRTRSAGSSSSRSRSSSRASRSRSASVNRRAPPRGNVFRGGKAPPPASRSTQQDPLERRNRLPPIRGTVPANRGRSPNNNHLASSLPEPQARYSKKQLPSIDPGRGSRQNAPPPPPLDDLRSKTFIIDKGTRKQPPKRKKVVRFK